MVLNVLMFRGGLYNLETVLFTGYILHSLDQCFSKWALTHLRTATSRPGLPVGSVATEPCGSHSFGFAVSSWEELWEAAAQAMPLLMAPFGGKW